VTPRPTVTREPPARATLPAGRHLPRFGELGLLRGQLRDPFVLAINEFLNILGAFSLGLALIQDSEESQSRYDTALVIYVALALAGIALSLAIAPLLWNTRGADAAWFLLALAGTRIFMLASQVPQAMLERRLQYGAVSAITAISGTLPNLLALGLAWQGMGAWCLVIRDVFVGFLVLVMGWAWSGYRFRSKVTREAATRLMPFAQTIARDSRAPSSYSISS